MRVHHLGIYGAAIMVLAFVTLPGRADAACMSKLATGRNGQPVKEHVIAPKSELARYEALGYVVEQCDVPMDQLKQAVDNICRMAAAAPPEVETHFARARGVSLEQLCESGRAGLAEMQANKGP